MTDTHTAARPPRQELRLRQEIMARRGATYPESPDPRNLLNPAAMKDGQKAAERLAQAILHNQTIIGVADFDCDGACGAAILSRGIQLLSKAVNRSPRLEIVIPDRFHYGYGLGVPLAEDQLAPKMPDVVVTIDNGISSVEAVAAMNAWQSAPVTIITDHHQPGEVLPPAYAIVNPNQPGCHFQSGALCGAGVIFNVLLLVRRALARLAPESARANLRDTQLNRLVELVTIATIGDVVPLDSNNRLLVRQGLARINRGWVMNAKESHAQGYLSFGVRRLLELADVTAPITSSDIAFKVVPQINGVGRLEKPRAGLACLLADNRIMANLEAEHCHRANQERKAIQSGMEQEADQLLAALEAGGGIAAGGTEASPSVVLHDDNWHPGLVGLVASRIKERTEGAVICFAPEGDPSEGGPVSDTLKGSGRSANVHLRDTLALVATWAPELGMRFGGHARAAGLSLDRAHLPRFRELFARAVAHQLQVSPLTNPDWHDGPLPRELRTMRFANWLEGQPWGQMFPEPVFSGRFDVEHVRLMSGRHLRLRVQDRENNTGKRQSFELVWFFAVPAGEEPAILAGDTVELDYTLGVNRWNGSVRLQGVVKGYARERTERPEPVRPVESAQGPAKAVAGPGSGGPSGTPATEPVAEAAPAPGVFGHAASAGGAFGFAAGSVAATGDRPPAGEVSGDTAARSEQRDAGGAAADSTPAEPGDASATESNSESSADGKAADPDIVYRPGVFGFAGNQ